MSAMNFNTANQTFRQLLANGLTYRVPPFQRDYSWTEDEWDDLWQDILGLYAPEGEKAHYMGYLVLQTSDNKEFDIIDGQQRITTLSILILAGLSWLQEFSIAGIDPENNLKRKEQLLNSYIGYVNPVSLVPSPKLSLNRHNNHFYKTYLIPLDRIPQRRLNASEHQLRKAFYWFKERMKARVGSHQDSGRELAGFIDSLVDKLFFTIITVTDELNAFKVFETLNARGVRLSATDLLKNYLFSVISSADVHDNEVKALEDRWENIVGLLGSESFPEFLRVFWNSRNRLVRKSELFKTIKRHVAARDTAFALLKNLDNSASIYSSLRDPQDAPWDQGEKAALEQLIMFSVRQPLSMLMACYERFFESNRPAFSKILRNVAVLSFRYNVICNLQTHEQERLYNDIARKVNDGVFTSHKQVADALSEIYPQDQQFKAAFAEKELRTTNTRNKKIVRYILFEIEKQVSGKAFEFESAKYTIEHILPENPSDEWNNIEESKQDRLIYRIGNMTILETAKNREIGNSSYSSKTAAYSESEFRITSAICEHYNTWDEKKVTARQNKMSDVAAGIWKME